jgi:branched-subunit amino acid ABC-type transport system permease component
MKVIAVDSHQIYRLGPLMLTDMHWLVFGCAFGLLTALHGVLTTSQLGRASVRALEAEPICGSLVTPSGERLRLWVSGLGAALAGIGGVLSGLYVNDVYPAMGTHLMPTLLALVLLGGLGNWRGALLMAFGMALLEGLWMPATHLVLPAKVFLLIALALGSLRPSGRDTESR